jgi:hypothetical protein
MKNAGVVLPVLFFVVLGDVSVKKKQPDVPAVESDWDLNGDSDAAIQDNPPIEDFLSLRQRNAELALQVEEMTSELRQLQHDKKMTMWRSKFAVSKVKRGCSSAVGEKEDSVAANARNARVTGNVAMMPWSLTHTATRHKMQSQFPGEGMFKDITNYFSEGSTAVQAVSSYLRKIPVLGKAGQAKKKEDEELHKLHVALKDARVRLGRDKEAKRGLEEHYNALVARIAQAKTQADAENQALEQAVKAEQDLDTKIAKIKEQMKRQAQMHVKAVKSEKQQLDEVQNVSIAA